MEAESLHENHEDELLNDQSASRRPGELEMAKHRNPVAIVQPDQRAVARAAKDLPPVIWRPRRCEIRFNPHLAAP